MSDSATPFSIELFARWPDMDFNQHMRNAAYLGVAEDCRMHYLASRGFTMQEFTKRQIGPVVLEDKLTYKKELKLLERFRVELQMLATTRDGRRNKVRNTVIRESDQAVCAVIESVVLWFDLVNRKPIAPPPELFEVWMSLQKTSDFEWFEEKK